MSLPIEVIAEISRAVVAEQHRDAEVLAVTGGDGGTNRVEILLSIHPLAEPHLVVLNLARGDRPELEADLRRQLADAFAPQ